MMMLTVLATGSAANAYILEADGEVLILDAGLKAKDIILKTNGSAVGCVVTHEHGDHARSALQLARRGIPVITSRGTAEAIGATENDGIIIAKPLSVTHVGGFKVMGFGVEHDASEPMGFLISRGKETLVYITDTYYSKYTFPGVNYWVVECNYIDDLIEETNAALRDRLKQSHLSLRRLKDMLKANDLSTATQIVLVHLSDSRSDEVRMVREIQEITDAEVTAARAGLSIRLDREPF